MFSVLPYTVCCVDKLTLYHIKVYVKQFVKIDGFWQNAAMIQSNRSSEVLNGIINLAIHSRKYQKLLQKSSSLVAFCALHRTP